jgi:hypothetical protein
MSVSAPVLAEYLMAQLPSGLPLSDAAQLCMRLYCTSDGVPKHLAASTSRDGLADTFVYLALSGWVAADGAGPVPTSRDTWLEVVGSVTKPAAWAYNLRLGEAIASRAGFK